MIRRGLLAAAAGPPIVLLAALLIVIFRSVILAPEKPRPGGQYTEGVVGPVGSLNPLFTDEDDNAHEASALLFEPLVRLTASGRGEGLLAEKWELGADQRIYTFTIRPGARWSDGSLVTSDDVLFTVRTIQNPQYPGSLLSTSWKDVTVAAVDSAHVRFTLPGRNASFLATLGQLDILPAHLLAGTPLPAMQSGPFAARPVGTGPFRLAERDADRLTLEPNPFSWRRPWLARIVLRSFASEDAALDAFRRGQIDAIANLSPAAAARARQDRHIAVHSVPTYRYTELLFNLRPEIPFFQDRRVRRAIAMSIDKKALVREILGGEASTADGPVPRAISWAVDGALQAPPHDPAQAAKLLDETGWMLNRSTRTRDGVPFRFELVVASDLPPYERVGRKLAADLAQVGIRVDVKPVPGTTLIRDFLNPRTFETALTALDNGPDPDVYPFWHSSQAHPGGFNFVSMKRNVFIDKDLEDGRASLNLADRAKAYFDLEQIFVQEVPAVYLYSPTFVFAVDRRIRGVRLDSAVEPFERYAHVSDWYIEVGR